MTEIFNIPDSYFAIIMVCWSPLHAHARPIDEIQNFDDKKFERVSDHSGDMAGDKIFCDR